ncbi:ribonuclease P protein component [Halobacteriovorax marinus]|uniref:Ribonuclease P protein component n=1 Tax=Halobacteriovorax marinus (strain ATCC BAA-682 / DSM 15412 / SJ) TaxID=862908 RepID=E1X1M2_HALMS|nr:ribonuclease P protein component [Halobacteriovorax marinus]ATH09449.1 ribonuclease P protein component [Halobacteriovorax marinus]CBW28190.1 Ribonuclease P protein component [Halobacteriovorax marinus SJ]
MADNSYDKSYRLLSAQDFSYLRKNSKRFKSKWLMAYYKPTRIRLPESHSRIGFSVTKKVGNAVLRNRYKRIMRDMFRNSTLKEKGLDILVIVSPYITKNNSNKDDQEKCLKDSFSHLLKTL